MLKILSLKGYKDNKYIQQIINLESLLFDSSFKQIYRIDSEIYYQIAMLDNQVVGYLTYKDNKEGYDIIQIGVVPNYQRQGIATKLMDKINDKPIVLEVNANNTKAVNFYYKLGFKKVVDLPNYYKNDDGIRMIKQ